MKQVEVVRLRNGDHTSPNERKLNDMYNKGYKLVAFDSVSGCGIFEYQWSNVNVVSNLEPQPQRTGGTGDPYPYTPTVFCGTERDYARTVADGIF